MTDEEKYLFDLQGFLVVEEALDAQQLHRLNAILEQKIEEEVPAEAHTHRFVGQLHWGKAYRDLIENPAVIPYLTALLGEHYRIDHDYLDIIRAGKGPIGTRLHGGAWPGRATSFYHCVNGEMRNGLFVVAYNLYDVQPGDGGFGAVAGSHKSNFPFPEPWQELEDSQHLPFVTQVTGRAGTAILFTEALTHGTLPWRGGERRTIFYKYSPHPLSWARDYYNAADFPDLTEAQKARLEPPNARRW